MIWKPLCKWCMMYITKKTLQHQGDCTMATRNCQVCLPINIEKLIDPDDEVVTLEEVCEELDFSSLKRRFKHNIYDCETMLKIVVYGYICGIFSSRPIETACRRDINFMWLLEGMPVPDHNTIARFKKEAKEEIQELFYQVVAFLHNKDEISYVNVFIDGTKIEANANKYSFVWKGSIEKFNRSNEEKIAAFRSDYNTRYKKHFKKISTIKKHIEQDIDKQGVVLVSGKGKHKTQLQRDYETLLSLLAKRKQYQKDLATFGDRKSFSKTDEDATFMHMKEDHMKNGQLKAGYNVQIAVDSEYIVNVGVFSDRTDVNTLIPFLKSTSKNVFNYQKIVADAGYESEENYVYLSKHNQMSYIKPQNYKQLKKNQHPYSRYNFSYIPEKDLFVCPEGNEMYPTQTKISKSKTGYQSEKTIYTTDKCNDCPNRDKCTKSKYGRQIQQSKVFEQFRIESLKNITTEEGILLRMNRSIQVEGAFGVIKQDYNFRRFLTRGKSNVVTEMFLLCLAYNIKKYNHKQRDKRTKTYLFKKDDAA